MSVIFEALRKIGRSQGSSPDVDVEDRLPANAYTIRQLIFSPQGLLGISLFILLVAVVAYYGANYLESIAQENKARTASAQDPGTAVHTSEQNNVVRAQAAEISEDVPPPPQQVTYKRAEPGKLYLPPAKDYHGDATKQPRYSGAVYLPPKPRTLVSSTGTPGLADGRAESAALAAGERVGKSSFTITPSMEHAEEQAALEKTEDRANIPPVPKPVVNEIRQSTITPRDSKVMGKPITVSEAKDIGKGARAEKIKERGVQESWEKTAAISRLVSRLQGAIMQDDEARVEELFPQLEKLKGADDLFLIKLRAYWQMKKGNYRKAAMLLERILAQRPNDCEAGLNMAIIEMRTGNVNRARHRLKALMKLYPTDTNISEILRKING